MSWYILLFTILGISHGYLAFKPKILEFRNKFHVTADLENRSHNLSKQKPANDGSVPIYFDWREKKAVSPVKNQLQCEACWAFSIVAAVESHVKIYTDAEEILSEQFLIDCDSENGVGCQAASLLQSYAFIVSQLGGILRDSDYYPYSHRQIACRWNPPGKHPSSLESYKDLISGAKLQISNAYPVPVIGFSRVKSDEDGMVNALYRHGPLTAAINSASMGKYNGNNVIDEPSDDQCNPGTPDHTVLIVGYNEYVPRDRNQRRVQYWIIKNSWGTQWGNSGFYYLVRGRNACGIANDVSFPIVS